MRVHTRRANRPPAQPNGFKDYCDQLTRRAFFKKSVSFPDVFGSFTQISEHVTAIELQGINCDLSAPALKTLIENSKDFSPRSETAQRLDTAFDVLEETFPEKSSFLAEQHFVQSLITLICQFIAAGKIEDLTKEELINFAAYFTENYKVFSFNDIDAEDTDIDYVNFRKAYRGNVTDSNVARHRILVKKMLASSPLFATAKGQALAAEIFAETKDMTTTKARSNNTFTLPPSNAVVFGNIMTATAQKKWGIRSSEELAPFLEGRPAIITLYPRLDLRKEAVAEYVAHYEGKRNPLGPYGNLTHEAGVMIHVLDLSSDDLERGIPALQRNLLYTDDLKSVRPDTAELMRRRGIYALTALEAAIGRSVFSEQMKKIAFSIFHDSNRLKRTSADWAISAIRYSLKQLPEIPALELQARRDTSQHLTL